MESHKPHAANVPGDFYVADGCCTMCGVPLQEAPGLFAAFDDSNGYQHCYVKKQPQDATELDQMILAVRCAELQCIRYRGIDRDVQSRLVEIGEGLACDQLSSELQGRFDDLDRQNLQHRLPPFPINDPHPQYGTSWMKRFLQSFFRKQ